ncbi:acyl-CoA thioesterase, partial [Salipiger sp. HF18]|nr:acyl-CoA thioesterase [Salipiger sp. HF18]
EVPELKILTETEEKRNRAAEIRRTLRRQFSAELKKAAEGRN